MGAWDGGMFSNDDAADWARDLVDSGSPTTVREALSHAASIAPGEYLESPQGCEALAAAAVIAAAAGQPGTRDAYSEAALTWGAEHPELATTEFVMLARAAVERVDGPKSELRELWLDDEDADPDDAREWAGAVADLRQRLAGP